MERTHIVVTNSAGNPGGDLLDRLRCSSQRHAALREATTICKEEGLSAERAVAVGDKKLPEQPAALS